MGLVEGNFRGLSGGELGADSYFPDSISDCFMDSGIMNLLSKKNKKLKTNIR